MRLDDTDETFITALIDGMTVEEKIGQMFQVDWRNMRPASNPLKAALRTTTQLVLPRIATTLFLHDDERPLTDKAAGAVSDAMLGSVLGGGGAAPNPNEPASWRAQNETLQAAAARTTSGIPLLVGNDTVHGQNNLQHATLFPHHIGLGCMRDWRGAPDTGLVAKLGAMAAAESFACGINWMFSPCVTVPQDLRWGRTYEGFSEDTHIVGMLGEAEVRGIQDGEVPMAACVKHWVGDGGTAFGSGTALFFWSGAPIHVLDQGDAVLSEAELRQVHLAAYLPALRAGALTVMASYSSWNGVKVHASEYLLTKLLKHELGFKGLVVSDYNAVQQCAPSFRQALALCINAGVDMVMTAGGLIGDLPWRQQIGHFRAAVSAGEIPLDRVDDAVRRILRVKSALGLLDDLIAPAANRTRRTRPLSEQARDRLYRCVGCGLSDPIHC